LHQEIEQFPDHFEKMEVRNGIELLFKMLPFALQKVEPESYRIG